MKPVLLEPNPEVSLVMTFQKTKIGTGSLSLIETR